MNLIIVLLASVKRLSKALRFSRSILLYIHNSTHMPIVSVKGVDKLLLLVMVVLSAIFNEALVLKAL